MNQMYRFLREKAKFQPYSGVESNGRFGIYANTEIKMFVDKAKEV